MSYQIETYHGNYNIVKRSTAVKYIVVHYTGSGTSASGSARANCIYFSGGNRNASAHYFIDDAHIFEYANPATYACWHVGDGKGKYGITNANSVGIEVCNSGGAFSAAEINRLTWLVKNLMNRFNVDAAHVVRHYDASRKLCPAHYAQNQNAWNTLHAHITGATNNGDDEVTNEDINNIAARVWSTDEGKTIVNRVYRNTAMLKAMCGLGVDSTGNIDENAHENIKSWTMNRWERSLKILKGIAGIEQDDTGEDNIKTPLHVTLSDSQISTIADAVAKQLSK
jgi:hypothetical protein